MNARRAAIALFLVMAMIAATACSSPGKPSKTVVLMTYDSFAISKVELAAFTRDTGYTVKILRSGDAGEMVSKAILVRNEPVADALFGIDNTFLTRALRAQVFQAYTAKAIKTVPKQFKLEPGHRVTPIDTAAVCVDADLAWFGHDGRPSAPTSLDDLTKPEYRKLLVVENPATSSPGLAFLLTTISGRGSRWPAFWRSMRSNGVRVDDTWDQAYDTDFTAGGPHGDRPLVVSYSTDPAADVVNSGGKKTKPSVGVVPGTCFAQVEFAGVLSHAKNRAGARALVDFMLSRLYQENLPLQMYVYPVVRHTKLPPVFVRFAKRPSALTIDDQQIDRHRTDWTEQWTRIVLQ